MAPDDLLVELSELLGSTREATWLVEEIGPLAAGARRERAHELATRRLAGEPLQYVLGHWPFRTLHLVVDARALIPRPETEQLVDQALLMLPDAGALGPTVVCDLGCGSGAIAISVAVEGSRTAGPLEVHATDLDAGATELARLNAERSGARGILFHQGSWYEALPDELRGRVDLLCANPPYVAATERGSLARELDFEPDIALVADDGTDGTPGFGAVERILLDAAPWLSPHGSVVVEHGERHRSAALAAARRGGLRDPVDVDDLAGRARFLVARAPA